MKRKILVDARMMGSSGIGVVLNNLLRRMVIERPDWHFLLLGNVASLRQLSWAQAANISFRQFGHPIHSGGEQICWPRGLASEADLLVCPNYNIPLLWRGPILTIVHDVAHLALKNIFGAFHLRAYARFGFEHVRRRSDAIVFVSSFSRDEFYRLAGKPNGTAVVIHNGVDKAWFNASRSVKPSAGHPTIIYVGNVKPHKNLKRLLAAFEAIKNEIPHTLLIVGKKGGFVTGEEGIASWSQRLGDRLRFTGEISDAELRDCLLTADALVLPSLYEGFGLPPLEAMSVGCPVLVSRGSALPEVCGDAAIYCDPLDVADIAAGLRRIVLDNELRSTLRERGFVRAREFDWEASAKLYLAAMEQAMS